MTKSLSRLFYRTLFFFQVSCDFFWCFFFHQGVTDSEKRVLCLSAENESLKHSLTVTQGLLQQLSVIPSQSSSVLIKVRLSFNALGILWIDYIKTMTLLTGVFTPSLVTFSVRPTTVSQRHWLSFTNHGHTHICKKNCMQTFLHRNLELIFKCILNFITF